MLQQQAARAPRCAQPARAAPSRPWAARARRVAAASAADDAAAPSAFQPVLAAEELPKGTRKVVQGPGGLSALLFWYRDSVYAVEPRSPAEGAYSEGFLGARLTQGGCIECPTTRTTFDLKTGAVVDWYPGNPVLGFLTPKETCRPMAVFPARLSADGAAVELSWGAEGAGAAVASAPTQGGADSSIERNNVYGLEPRVYLEDGREVSEETGRVKAKPAELILATVAVAIVAVAGTAIAIAKESIPGLIVFWVALLTPVGLYVFKAPEEGDASGPPA